MPYYIKFNEKNIFNFIRKQFAIEFIKFNERGALKNIISETDPVNIAVGNGFTKLQFFTSSKSGKNDKSIKSYSS